MMAADNDFYLATPTLPDNQVGFNFDCKMVNDSPKSIRSATLHSNDSNLPIASTNCPIVKNSSNSMKANSNNMSAHTSSVEDCSNNVVDIKDSIRASSAVLKGPSYNTKVCAVNVLNDHVNPLYVRDFSESAASSRYASSELARSDVFYNTSFLYGWKCFSSKLLQVINKPLFFVLILCLGGIAQGLVVTGIAFTVLTSIEKQFGLKSSQVALFGTAYDTAYGVCSIFVGYVGHSHKPRCIGWGLLIMALGAVLVSVPKFVIGPYEAGVERYSDFCHISNGTNTDIICDSPNMWQYQLIFILGNVLLGIGATPLYTLAPAHIDEVTSRGESSLYMGIYYASSALGPAMGFIIGMPVLNTWVDLKQPSTSTLTPTDTNWVGAWWLGYLIGAALLLLPVIPMLGFPKVFPDAEEVRTRKLELEDTIEEDKDLKHDFKSVWPATKALLKNPPYILITLAIASESLAIGGFSTFLPKFVETQFHFTASNSALYTGIIVIPGAAGGIFLGGYLVKRFRWNCKEILRSASVMAFIAALCLVTALVGCKGRDVVGQGTILQNNSFLESQCNIGCQCNTEFYKPICSVNDQRTFYSPCHAGCQKKDAINNEFFNCSCFSDKVTVAVNGRCVSECSLFPLFVVGAFLLMFFTFMNNVPMLNATFRVVNEGQGSFAMGFQQIFVRFLGFIPAPIMFGALIDKSCKLWLKDQCSGETTSCLEYQLDEFRYYMFALGITTKFVSFLFIFLAYKFYRLPENMTPPSPTHEMHVQTLKEMPA